MRVVFTTKDESNQEREQAFLALSGEDRMREFFALSRKIMREFPSSIPSDYGDNLVLERPNAKEKEHTC